MISTAVFIALLVFDFLLIATVFLARDHQMYADVIAAVGATIFSWYLALSTLNGNVGETVTTGTTAVENVTTGTTTVSYTTSTIPFVDLGLALLLSGLAAVMTIVAFALVLRAGLELVESE
ncbi:MAG: hypothetical protein WC145_12215 [Aliarcobacter sp.]|jgi:hypothetical protein